ncbi:MAG: PfaD family polyunsaturated fatty acid/polyketide biosynthesis protein [Alphaproteobacteria bacterium]|nr:PfaD family polyunsaturated fatty acid/polyketide biosynthesis protein [Alphaproteobacteria bacterium]
MNAPFLQDAADPSLGDDPHLRAVRSIRNGVALVQRSGHLSIRPILVDAAGQLHEPLCADEGIVGVLPPLFPEWLGERSFASDHGVRFAYVVGEMARGIATPEMAVSAVRAGLAGFYGSAGLNIPTINEGLSRIRQQLGDGHPGWGANLIHSPQHSEAELQAVETFLQHGVARVSASAFMKIAPSIVIYAARGLSRAADGSIARGTHVFAKVSRAEVARQFLSPPPEALLRALTGEGRITPEQAELARRVPIAEDLTAEADSGGHTDNRPLSVLVPQLAALRDALCAEFCYPTRPRIGAAGGIGTPAAVAGAFALGAAYVLTGSINQSAVESGLSADGRAMLAEAGPTDVAMAPAADMFEMGVKVQVLRRGTLFAQRGQKLFDLYRAHDRFEAIEAGERKAIETQILRRRFDEVWQETRDFFLRANPREAERGERDLKHRMALVFRWYLFMGAQWARDGLSERRADYQIWCGPSMGAFNAWVKGSFLEAPQDRGVAQIALNLLEGAACLTRAQHLRLAGVALPPAAFQFVPRPLA